MVGGLRKSFQTSLHRPLPWGLNLCLGCVWRLRHTKKLRRPALPLSVVVTGGSVHLKGTSETQFALQCAAFSIWRSRVSSQCPSSGALTRSG